MDEWQDNRASVDGNGSEDVGRRQLTSVVAACSLTNHIGPAASCMPRRRAAADRRRRLDRRCGSAGRDRHGWGAGQHLDSPDVDSSRSILNLSRYWLAYLCAFLPVIVLVTTGYLQLVRLRR